MHEAVDATCAALDALATAITSATGDDRTMLEMFGWNCPALTRHDLAAIPTQLSARLKEIAPETLDAAMEQRLRALPGQLSAVQASTVPQLFNGNGAGAAPALMTAFSAIERVLEPILGWQKIDAAEIPPKLARRLRAFSAQLDELTPDREKLTETIKQISSAREAAENLPVDLQELSEARKRITDIAKDADKHFKQIVKLDEDSKPLVQSLTSRDNEAAQIIQRCEDAYKITTTQGLAAAFQQRAGSLGKSVWMWVALLLLSLTIGALLGYKRIGVITAALTVENPNTGVLLLQFALSALSVGAPLWFAWLATKQIGQRFRLAEDYAFKASVAKAYEGYRSEAVRIDKDLEKRLFASALERLDEAPLRLIEVDAHGGPWSEIFNSKLFERALSTYPDLKEQFVHLANIAIARVSSSKSKGEAGAASSQPPSA